MGVLGYGGVGVWRYTDTPLPRYALGAEARGNLINLRNLSLLLERGA